MLRYLAVSFMTLAVAFAGTPAAAQIVCGEHAEIVKVLERNHQERRSAMGLAANGRLVELFIAEDGGWTLLATTPEGLTCLISAGEDWVDAKPEPGEAAFGPSY
jgi:hypothetical protein